METAERLIVAADFDPRKCGGVGGAHGKVLALAEALQGMGVIIKVNSILRAYGYGLIHQLHDMGLRVFADLKLNDIPETMDTDAAMLADSWHRPEIVTVMCGASSIGMRRVKDALGARTLVLGVTVLTSMDKPHCNAVYVTDPEETVVRLARLAFVGHADGLILSPKEVATVRAIPELGELRLVTPGIRPVWATVEGDDQKRTATPADAIRSGAERIVVGRPITQATDPRDAVQRTLEEIAAAVAA